MSDTPDPPDAGDVDPGEPIEELSAFEEDADTRLLSRIRGSIHRRMAASDAIDFSVMAFFRTFMDYLAATIEAIVGVQNDHKEDR